MLERFREAEDFFQQVYPHFDAMLEQSAQEYREWVKRYPTTEYGFFLEHLKDIETSFIVPEYEDKIYRTFVQLGIKDIITAAEILRTYAEDIGLMLTEYAFSDFNCSFTDYVFFYDKKN
jgi:hypothetical protein